MGFFQSSGENKKPEKEEFENWLGIHGLKNVQPDSYEQIKNICNNLWGLSFDSSIVTKNGTAKDTYNLVAGIVEQNWLLIKQNDQLQKQNNEIIGLLKNK